MGDKEPSAMRSTSSGTDCTVKLCRHHPWMCPTLALRSSLQAQCIAPLSIQQHQVLLPLLEDPDLVLICIKGECISYRNTRKHSVINSCPVHNYCLIAFSQTKLALFQRCGQSLSWRGGRTWHETGRTRLIHNLNSYYRVVWTSEVLSH